MRTLQTGATVTGFIETCLRSFKHDNPRLELHIHCKSDKFYLGRCDLLSRTAVDPVSTPAFSGCCLHTMNLQEAVLKIVRMHGKFNWFITFSKKIAYLTELFSRSAICNDDIAWSVPRVCVVCESRIMHNFFLCISASVLTDDCRSLIPSSKCAG